MGGLTLRPRERLRAAPEFRRVFRQGMRYDGPLFLLVAAPNGSATSRLGLAASRRVGDASARNRAKRLLRECFRRNKPAAGVGLDLVFVPKREITECSLAEVEGEYRRRLAGLLSRRDPPRRSRPGAPPAR